MFAVNLALLVREGHEARVFAGRMILKRNTEEVTIAGGGSEYLVKALARLFRTMIQGVAVKDAEDCVTWHARKNGWEYVGEIAGDERRQRTAGHAEGSLKEMRPL